MRSRSRDNTPGGSCGDVFLKTQSYIEFWIRIRFLKRKNQVDTLTKALNKSIGLNLVLYMEFDQFLVLKFQFPFACQLYRPDKSIWKNFIPVFCTWNWNNHHLVHLWKVSLFLCFSMVTAACHVLLIIHNFTIQEHFELSPLQVDTFYLLFIIFHSNINISFRLSFISSVGCFVIQLILTGGLPKSLCIRLHAQAGFRIV